MQSTLYPVQRVGWNRSGCKRLRPGWFPVYHSGIASRWFHHTWQRRGTRCRSKLALPQRLPDGSTIALYLKIRSDDIRRVIDDQYPVASLLSLLSTSGAPCATNGMALGIPSVPVVWLFPPQSVLNQVSTVNVARSSLAGCQRSHNAGGRRELQRRAGFNRDGVSFVGVRGFVCRRYPPPARRSNTQFRW